MRDVKNARSKSVSSRIPSRRNLRALSVAPVLKREKKKKLAVITHLAMMTERV